MQCSARCEMTYFSAFKGYYFTGGAALCATQ
jgi:hypothetical protein